MRKQNRRLENQRMCPNYLTKYASVLIEGTDNILNYCITAKHIISKIKKYCIDQKVHIRVNTRDGQHKILSHPVDQWLDHPNDSSVDVAILSAPLPNHEMDYLSLPIAMAATPEKIKEEGVGIGDEVFITGLFVNHYGNMRNLPIVRIGNIALMPEEPISTEMQGDIDAYLIEARSIGGLSGSPVFVHLTGIRPKGNKESRIVSGTFYWLGLMHGHWDAPVATVDTLIQDSHNERINVGIAVVVPVSKIIEVIKRDEFLQTMKEVKQQIIRERSPTSD